MRSVGGKVAVPVSHPERRGNVPLFRGVGRKLGDSAVVTCRGVAFQVGERVVPLEEPVVLEPLLEQEFESLVPPDRLREGRVTGNYSPP